MENTKLFIFIMAFFITKIVIKYFYSLLYNNKCLSFNYKNNKIPIGIGIVFVFVQIFMINLLLVLRNKINIIYEVYLLNLTIIGFTGFIDDTIGDKNVKGFRGHINSLLNGNLTTGMLKAINGFFCSIIFIIIFNKGIYQNTLNIILIVLFTNFINLLDLRPGRSIKTFILISIFLAFSSINKEYDVLIFSMLGISIAYLPIDIKANAMIGDTGSNSLGITLGMYTCLTQPYIIKVIIIIILIIIHIVSETNSITKIIKNNNTLSYLDNIGR